MKKYCILILVLFPNLSIIAQNLVPNPSFEDNWLCPYHLGEIQKINDWYKLNNHSGFLSYFHTCGNPDTDIPNNYYGSQNARTDNGYIGFNAYYPDGPQGYLQVKLISELKKGVKYKIKYWVSLAEKSSWAIGGLGALLTDTAIDGTVYGSYGTIVSSNNVKTLKIIESKNSWSLISLDYVAHGGEKYLTIGCFSSERHIKKKFVGVSDVFRYAYYYLDDVSIDSCRSYPERIKKDTIYSCYKDQVILKNKYDETSYLWNTGETSDSLLVDTAGLYWLKRTTFCDTQIDTFIVINYTDKFNSLIKDTTLCNGDSLVVSLKEFKNKIHWFDNDSSSQKTFLTQGRYWVEERGICENRRHSIDIKYIAIPNVDLRNDTSICSKTSIQLSTTNNPQNKYLWNDGSTRNSLVAIDSGMYWVQVSNMCGSNSDSMVLKYKNCKACQPIIPSAFTPNNDLLNDVFKPFFNCEIEDYSIHLFNRWGEELFYSNDINKSWDGTYKGKPVPPGTYFYTLQYKPLYESNFEKEVFNTIVVIRKKE